jgi:hypothetical protein
MSDWSEHLPRRLRDSAYRAAGTSELAWTKSQALEVLDYAAALAIPIVGVEVWLPTMPGPTVPTQPYYGFRSSRRLISARSSGLRSNKPGTLLNASSGTLLISGTEEGSRTSISRSMWIDVRSSGAWTPPGGVPPYQRT